MGRPISGHDHGVVIRSKNTKKIIKYKIPKRVHQDWGAPTSLYDFLSANPVLYLILILADRCRWRKPEYIDGGTGLL
jgi:hypothetical protein